jgi:hypothetical protein
LVPGTAASFKQDVKANSMTLAFPKNLLGRSFHYAPGSIPSYGSSSSLAQVRPSYAHSPPFIDGMIIEQTNEKL